MAGRPRGRSPPVDFLAARWAGLRGGLGAEALGYLERTRQACPRILGSLDDLNDEELRGHFARAALSAAVPELTDEDYSAIKEVVSKAGALRSHGIRRSAALPTETRAAGGLVLERDAKRRVVATLASAQSVWDRPPPPKGGRWPTRLARARAEGVDLNEADRASRRKYVDQLVEELKRLVLPVVAVAGHSLAGDDRLTYLAAGKRTGTLRRRLGDWTRLRKWLEGQSRAAGFPTEMDLIDYLEARAAEPCGKTVLQSAVEAVRFLETVGSVPRELQISQAALVVAAVGELSSRLVSKRSDDRRQANYLPVKLLMALEHTVVNEEQPAFVRYYAWLRLVKYWASLRFDDLRWVDPAKVALTEAGLRMDLERTKVTGPGKKVGTLVAFVSRAAYFEAPAWLATGFDLRRSHLANARCMFPLPTGDLQGVLDVPGDYADASAASQALFTGLLGPSPGPDSPYVDPNLDTFRLGIHLMPPGAGLFWTEHSERNGLPTAAAALGYPDDTIRRLGRWQMGSVAEAYIRSTMNIVAEVQGRLAARVRGVGEDFLDEGATLKKLSHFLQARGLGDPDRKLLEERLVHFNVARGVAVARSVEDQVDKVIAPLAHEGSHTRQLPEEDDEQEPQAEALGGYVVSVVGRRRFRRLHHISRCGMLPGTDYKEYVWYGEALPDPALYDEICSRCWRRRATFDLEAANAAAEVATASSSGESDTATTSPVSEPA